MVIHTVDKTCGRHAPPGYPQAVDKLRGYQKAPEFYNDLVNYRRVGLTRLSTPTCG
jgi:hypothetical protein